MKNLNSMMTKMIQDQTSNTSTVLKKTKEGRINNKKNEETFGGIPIEKKNYKLSELTALEGKFKKLGTELSVSDDKNDV